MAYMSKYPIGVQSFSEIREGGYIYVDKTEYIYRLINEGKYYFMSRPRRFGKSLLLSTIEAYYQGRRDLFKNLALDRLADSWEPHPVLHLDLNSREYNQPDSLKKELQKYLAKWETLYGCENSDKDVEERFSHIIEQAYLKTGKKVVVLVDEYDKPLLNAIHDSELADTYRSMLKAFYANIKSMDRYLEFAMLTGVARFSKISIFSDLNNLRDITFQRDFDTICGITPAELEEYFEPGIVRLGQQNGIDRQSTILKLKEWYDGYHFSRNLQDVYNPFSLVNVFAANEFYNYWFESGTPYYLVQVLEKNPIELRLISGFKIDGQTLSSAGIMAQDPIITLYQSGYLTISGYDPESDLLTLDYPNREVKESLLKYLVPYYTRLTETETGFAISRFVREVRDGDPAAFMKRLSALVARIPYGGKGIAPEDHFQNAIYLIFTLMGYMSHLEDRTSNGRIDMTVETSGFVYIFEFKVNKSAKDALSQILEHEYWKGYETSGKKIYLIAANFDSASKTLDDIIIEER